MHAQAPFNQAFALDSLRRISLFIGAYGSGKSEVSVNFARWLTETGHPVTLCDLDIINPYFRSADARLAVETAGIRLVAPAFAGTNVDVPAVPAAVYSVFDDASRHAVLDVGGEDMGARVIASLKDRLGQVKPAPAVYLVVNPYRPFSSSSQQIVQLASLLGEAAGLAPTGLVHNANLLEAGDATLLSESWPVVREAARLLGIPVTFAAAMAGAVPPDWGGRTPEGLPLLRLRRSIRYFESD
ncbi:MAG: hypothetical protein GX112_05345 [Clostridiaceae bacterium]|jgi:hypothetical protein|nr:hypothetical protein [Clostridiaceae bacterium]